MRLSFMCDLLKTEKLKSSRQADAKELVGGSQKPLLQPLGHQVPFIFLEAGCSIQRLRALIFPAHLKAHSRDAGFPAQIFCKDDHGLAQLLSAIWFAQIEF